MHAALREISTDQAEAADFVAEDLLIAAPPKKPEEPYRPSSYESPRLRGPAGTIVLAGHAILLVLIASLGAGYVKSEKRTPTVVNVIDLPLDPPPAPPPPDQPVPIKPTPAVIVAPPPLVSLPPPPQPVQAVPEPPAPRPVEAPQPPPGPVTASDLSTSMISANPPKYPIESRRRKEQGTVVLSVLLGTSGAVEQVSIARSSGFDRLDKAALDAVRRWRWSATVRSGQPVMVKGYVEIPFVLT